MALHFLLLCLAAIHLSLLQFYRASLLPHLEAKQEIKGKGFHRYYDIQLTSKAKRDDVFIFCNQIPRESYIDTFQLQKYYKEQVKLLDIWTSTVPDLEIPSSMAKSFRTILTFSSLKE